MRQRFQGQQCLALYFSAVCCSTPALILAGGEGCELGPIGPKILEHSSKALDFLKSCDHGFVKKYVGLNHGKPEKMNPILETLKLHSPMDWEFLSEGIVGVRSLDLEACVSRCNRQDEYADLLTNAYEELFEDFEEKIVGSSKPDYTCPKCVQFLPADLLVNVPDVLWGL